MRPRQLPAAIASFALLSTLFAQAQQPAPVPQFTDPANLRGERVKPHDGRELPIDQGARGLEQMLRRLNTRASLMLIVAHPDDEDGGMLTYYSRGLGARVAVLTLTRGEGGQNAMTGDFEDALGLLRTQELLSADRYLGVDQFFGTEVDFGFSKTKEEAFKKWTHERVLYDAVRSIRLYRPLVIAAVFIGGVTDGHGQHQVSGQIAQEAFKAAADPTVFPDMIAEGILPWQALKVYARVPSYSISDKGLFDYATGKYAAPRFDNYVTDEVTTTVPSSDVIVHEGTVDPILSDSPSDPPRSYIQFARIGLGLQKSQIGNGFRVAPAGAFDVAYHRYGSKLPNQPEHETSFFDGIDTSFGGMADLAPSAKDKIAMVIKSNLSGIKHNIAEAQLDLKPGHPELAANRLAEALTLTDMAVSNIETFKPAWLPADQRANLLHELRIKHVQLNDALVLALGLHLYAATTESELPAGRLANAVVSSTQTSHEAKLTAVRGESNGKFSTNLPPVSKNQRPLCTLNATDVVPTLPYFRRESIRAPVYQLEMPAWRNSALGPPAFVCMGVFTYQAAAIRVAAVVRSGIQPVRFMPADTDRLERVGYADLPRTNYISRPANTITLANLNLPQHLRLAYLPGTGDAVPEALASINLKPDLLTVADLTPAKLAQYDTVILGVRTYAAHPELHGAPTQALLDYARNGGNVLVQYQTAEFTAADAPYPLSLGYSAEKVVDETDPVQLLDPTAPLLTLPNRITPADFNGWVEERGHGFLESWDTHYTALTETHDPDQDPQRGGLITVNIGKGRWTYCAFALYRQLPEAVPGAFRLFVNLISPVTPQQH